MIVSKTDYILFRECHKNAWLKIHKPDIFYASKLSDFELSIIETGNEVEIEARKLFPSGFLIEGRDEESQKLTAELIAKKQPVIFQGAFLKNNFFAAVDILQYDEAKQEYYLYEVKATTSVDKKTHYNDLAFQVNLLEMCGIMVSKAFVIHLDSEYLRNGEINIYKLFVTEEVTEPVMDLKMQVAGEMQKTLQYLGQESEPTGPCDCVYKGRSNHCATFKYSNPTVPAYGVHDISRIGASKRQLQELIDTGVFKLDDVSEDMVSKLTEPQKNQIFVYVKDIILKDLNNIQGELGGLQFPLYFLDYETFPAAIPRFDGFSPYQQIPFQYSLYVLPAPGGELQHQEFLFAESTDPTEPFADSLVKNLGDKGSIIVWNKKFECKINEELAKRRPLQKIAIEAINARVYDLMDIFGKQYYVHKGFKGKISIKNVLPVLVPELSYKTLNIQEGGTASQKWNEIVTFASPEEKAKVIADLKEYCKLDTLAMVKIYEHLIEVISQV